MNIKTTTVNNTKIAIVSSDMECITDGQTALDFIMTVNYETGCHLIVINKDSVTEEFFVLSSGIAGDIVQKFVNYHFKVAIIGDYSGYTSKPLKDFIYESNKGNVILFVSSEEQAIEKLGQL